MRHKDKRRAMAITQAEDQIHDRRPVGAIKVSGRLIGQKDCRTRGCSTCQSHALLLSPRHLGGVMVHPRAQSYGRQFRLGALKGIRDARNLHWQGHVFQCRHRGDQVKALKHHPHTPAPEPGKLIFVHASQILT